MKVVPFIAIFAIGGLLGMLATRAMVEVGAPPERGSAAHEAESGPVPAIAEEDAAAADPAAASADLPDAEEQTLLVRAIEAVDPVDLGDRTGRITGRIALFDGAPLAGVEVTATPGSRPGREDPENLEGKVRRFIRDEKWRTGLESKGSTGSDGTYLLEGIGELDYRVGAKLSGYKFESRGRRASRPGDIVDFIATPVAQIEVMVMSSDGTEPDQATLQVERDRHGTSSYVWRPKERIQNVDPGVFKVSASVPEGERSEKVEVSAEAGAPPVPVRLVLRTRGSIRGELVLPPEELDTTVTIYLLPAALKPDATAEDLLTADKKSWTSRGQPFTFDDLDPGGYWIGAARGHEHQGQLPTIQLVEVAESPVDVSIEIEPIPIEDGVLVYVYAPSGALLPDASLNFGVTSPNGSSWGGGMSTRLRDGGALLIADRNIEMGRQQDSNAKCFVSAHHGVYGEKRVEVSSPYGQRVEIRYQDPATALVSVAGYVGSAAVGKVQIQLTPDDGTDQRQHYWYQEETGIDANGEARIGPLVPGPHRLRMNYVDRRGNQWSSGLLLELPVTLVSGENRLSVQVPALHTLEVVFPVATASGSVQVKREGEENPYGARHSNFSEGVARIEGLVAGRYSVQAWGEGMKSGTALVDVPASGPFHFEPAPINALRIQVNDDAGPLAQAGFKSGDMIVKINGMPFEGEEQLAVIGVFLQGAEEVKVTVDRGGEEVELTVDPRKLMRGDPGGSLDPTVR